MSLFSPENRPWTLLLFGSVAALAAFLLLSGGDPAEAAPGGVATTSPAADAAGSVSELGDEAANPRGDDVTAGVLSSDECLTAASSLSLAASGGLDPSGTGDVQTIADSFARMSAVAPAEIQEDLAAISAALSQFFSILSEEGIDFNDPASLSNPAAADAFRRAGAALEASDFQQAVDDVDAWFQVACGGFVSG